MSNSGYTPVTYGGSTWLYRWKDNALYSYEPGEYASGKKRVGDTYYIERQIATRDDAGKVSFNFQPSPATLQGSGLSASGTDKYTVGGIEYYAADIGLSPQEALMRQFQRAQAEAKTTNEQRYTDILAAYEKMYQSAQSDLAGLGASQVADIESRWKSQETAGMQDLVSRGLTNTTLLPGMKALYERGKGMELQSLQDTLARERLGTLTGLESQRLGFMERRDDTYPDMNLLAQLSQAYGASTVGPTSIGSSRTPLVGYGGSGSSSSSAVPSQAQSWYVQPSYKNVQYVNGYPSRVWWSSSPTPYTASA